MSINPQCREPGSYQSLTLFFSEPDLASQASQKTFQGCAQTNSLYIHCGWIQFPEDSGSGIVTPQSYIWSPSAARDGTSSLDQYCFGRNYVGFTDFVFLNCSSGVGTSESPAILLAPCYPVTSRWCRQCTESYAYFSCTLKTTTPTSTIIGAYVTSYKGYSMHIPNSQRQSGSH